MSVQVAPPILVFDVTRAPYNARGDGSTNDLAAINAATLAASTAGGGVVWFSATKTFAVTPTTTTWLNAYSNVTFAGGGTIKVTANAGDYKYLFAPAGGPSTTVSNVGWHGLTIDHNVAANTTSNISATNGQATFRFDSFDRLWWSNCKVTYPSVNCWQLLASPTAGTSVSIADCEATFVRGTSSTYYDSSTIYAACASAAITGNVFRYAGTGANAPQGCIEVHGPHQVVTGNTVEKFGVGTWLVPEASGTSRPVQGVVCTGNTYLSCGIGVGMLSATATKTIRQVIVADNSIHLDTVFHTKKTTYGGIVVAFDTGYAPSERLAIHDNTISFETGDTRTTNGDGTTIVWDVSCGISIGVPTTKTLKGLICHDNQIYNAPGAGIRVQGGAGGTYEDLWVHHNLIVDAGLNTGLAGTARVGLSILGTGEYTRCVVERNRVVDTGSGALNGVWAWRMTTLSGTAKDLTFRGNEFASAFGTLSTLVDSTNAKLNEALLGLADPGADRIAFWDDSTQDFAWLQAGTGLAIAGTTISATGGTQEDITSRRVGSVAKIPGTSTTMQGSGGLSNGTGTVTAGDDADGPWLVQTTSTTDNNSVAAQDTGLVFTQARRDWDPEFFARVKSGSDATSVHYFAGLCTAAIGAATTRPTAQHVAGFDYDTDIDGTAFWRAWTSDGAANTVTATTVAIAADTVYELRAELGASSVVFSINGTVVATHTTNLPGATTSLGWYVSVTTRTTAARSWKWARVAIASEG